MTVVEILNSVKFVVDPDGHQSAVVVDLDVWEQIVKLLEDTEDAEEIKRARAIKEETIPWKTAKKELKLGIGVSC
jgi:Mg2+/Co2+ transporter CorC